MRTPSQSIKKNMGVGDARVRSLENRINALESNHMSNVKVVTELPETLKANTIYVVVEGEGEE